MLRAPGASRHEIRDRPLWCVCPLAARMAAGGLRPVRNSTAGFPTNRPLPPCMAPRAVRPRCARLRAGRHFLLVFGVSAVKTTFAFLRRFAVTTVAVVAAFLVGGYLWIYYMDEPWTRDGRVRADIDDVAPDVAGFVTDVMVRDNQQVRRGAILFQIDRARFALALQQADAVVAGRRASLDQAEGDLKRYRQLTTLAVSQQKQEQVLATEQQAKAAYDQAVADRAVAQLNFDRSEVYASVNGTISNMDLRPGTYVTAGKGVMALVDSDTLHVEGYFEETKLPRIHVGDRVAIRLMGSAVPLRGLCQEDARASCCAEHEGGPFRAVPYGEASN